MKLTLLALFGTAALWLTGARAADVAGSRDHPMISRYQGSSIVNYQQHDFDAYGLLIKRVANYGGKEQNLDAARTLEGRVTRITYAAPDQRTTLEVFRNYQNALTAAGFKMLFTCNNESCGGRNFNHAVVEYTGEFGDQYADQRYLAAHLPRSTGDVFVSLYVTGYVTQGGSGPFRAFTQLDVIEVAPMQAGMVTVDAGAMAKALDTEGHIALYNIYFDTGKADLKPGSAPALAEIARLLGANSRLQLLIVGHTDNVGELGFNEQLSLRRAQAVVSVLRATHGVHGSRLTARGVGMYAPVADNTSEAGRAKNRRVELVKR